jgi:hypothetical protein
MADPLDFTTAITDVTSPVHPGDTLWVRGGVYKAPIPGFTFSLNGTAAQPILFRNYNTERAVIDGTFKAHGAHVSYWGLEFTDLSTPYLPMSMTRAQKEALMLAGSYPFCAFYLESAPYSRFINNIFHDSFGQIEYGISSSNSLFYGNIVLNMGEQCSDNERGVGLYTQNRDGTRDVVDNIVGQIILNGIDVWSSGNAFINNFTVEGNICFNNGYGKLQGGRNLLSGAGNGCTNLLMQSNVLYYCSDSYNRPNLIVGHGGQSLAPRVRSNLMINGGFEIDESFGQMDFSGNEVLSTATWNNIYTVWPRDRKPTAYLFNNNKYYGGPLIEVTLWITNSAYPQGTFSRVAVPNQWSGWQRLWDTYKGAGDHFYPDAASLYTSAKPTGTRVIVRKNQFEPGRAHIAILNFDLKSTVDVDLSSLGLPLNTTYELHPVQNLFNQTNTGTYTGAPITVPMTGWGIRQPPSRAADLTSTFPQFGAFLFIARNTTGNTPPTLGPVPDQSINEDTSTGAIPFTVSDQETAASQIILTASSSNPILVPSENIVFGGAGTSRTVTLTPAANKSGSAVITVTANDGWAKTTQTFNVTVKPVNDPPVISSAIGPQTIPMNGSSGLLTILVGDPESPAESLVVTVTSSNPALIPDSGLSLSGAGAARTLRLTPAAGAAGTATITIQVSDLAATTTQQFLVTVAPSSITRPPTISDIGDRWSVDGSPVRNIPFLVADPDTAVSTLTVTGVSDNPTLLPTSGIVLSGTGASRAVSLIPAPGRTGRTVVTLTVTDGRNKAIESFVLTVGPVAAADTPPTISSLPDIAVPGGTPVAGPYSFVVGDSETPAAGLAVGASSSATSLVRAGDLILGGSGAVRSITVYPEPGQSGSSWILLWVSDGRNATTNSFRFTVRPSNTPPVLSGLPSPDYTLPEDGSGTLPFTVQDGETPADALAVTATCLDTNLVPSERLVVEGTGTNRSLTITPAPNANGIATVTVTVSDGTNRVTTAFDLIVAPGPDGPSLAEIGPVILPNDVGTRAVPLSVDDPDLADPALAGLSFAAWSDNPSLIPGSALSVSGSGPSRHLNIAVPQGAVGTNRIFVSATDGWLSATQSFQLTITPPNRAPVVDAGTNAVIYSSLNYMLRGRVTDDGLPLSPGRPTMRWSQVSGPGTVSFSAPTYAICAARFSGTGFYRLRLTATDGELAASDDVFIMVRTNSDLTPPVISGLQVGEVTDDSITVSWSTDENASEQIEYGRNGVFERSTLLRPDLGQRHTITASNLAPDTLYVVRAKSRDGSANLAVSRTLTVRTLRTTPVYIALRADAAQVEAPMALADDAASAGERYLGTPSEGQGAAVWTFQAPVPGTYHVWARVFAPDTRRDSFDVSVDGGPADTYDVAESSWSSRWQWTRVNGRDGVAPLTLNPRTFRLTAGPHTLRLLGREAQTLVSRLLVTNDREFAPSDDSSVLGVAVASTLDGYAARISLPPGWSMLANPLAAADPTIARLLPSPPAGTRFEQYNPLTEDFNPTTYSAGQWDDPSLTLGIGEGGLVFNPTAGPLALVLSGQGLTGMPSTSLAPGRNLIAFQVPVAGTLQSLMAGVTFVAGDSVRKVDPETRAYVTSTLTSQGWDVVPVVNLGEAVFLDLVPR